MAIISNTVNYLDDSVVLEGFFAFDDTQQGRRPAVLIAPTWAGRDNFAKEKALQLAALGYVGFALDMYGAGKVGNSPEENAQLMQPFIDNRVLLQQRVRAALTSVSCLPWVDDSNIAAIGFCFGGLCVLDLARTGVAIKGVVSFHGLLKAANNLPQPNIKAKVLVLQGHDDPLSSPEEVCALQRELSQANADWQLHSYGHTVHAFTNPNANNPAAGMLYHPLASQRAWQTMRNFLSEIFV